MTDSARLKLALQITVDTLHATASASPEAEFAVHECFEALRALGVDTRHSEEGKPRKTFVEQVKPKAEQRGFFDPTTPPDLQKSTQ